MSLLLLLLPSAWAVSPSRAGDLTFTEFQADTNVVPQYYGEWFEIRNNTAAPMDLQGLTFTCAAGTFTVSTPLFVGGGAYAVLGANGDSTRNGGLTQVDYVYTFSGFNLSRSADFLRMEIGGLVIDEVTWTSDWGALPDASQQASRNAMANEWANDLRRNWCSSTTYISGSGMRGTPGVQNRYCSSTPGSDGDGDGYSPADGDCYDDSEDGIAGDVNPGEVDDAAGERAGRDDDCDGVRDDGETDDDLDGFTEVMGDCDDSSPARYPRGAEVVDGLDNDCDGCVDDIDEDGDGWTECEIPFDRNADGDTSDAGEARASDCDESQGGINPQGTEVPYDGIDQDCDGLDDCDVDGDGWNSDVCPNGTDCDDADATVNPGALEDNADGIDNDCNGEVDVPDRDGDGWAVVDGDCMDLTEEEDPVRGPLSASVHPEATEVCGDLLDNDCDGFIDNLPACASPASSATVRGGGMCGLVGAGAGAWMLAGVGLTAVLARRRRGGAA